MDDHKEKEKEHTGGNPDVPEEEEEDEEAKRAVLLGPQVPLKEQLELDKVTANH
jgi:Rho GDP-dissociation inhibitor